MGQAADVPSGAPPPIHKAGPSTLSTADTYSFILHPPSIDSPQQKAAGSDTTHGLGVHAAIRIVAGKETSRGPRIGATAC